MNPQSPKRLFFQDPLTILHGVERALYLECDEIQNKRRLTQLAQTYDATITDIESMLAPLVERGLLLQDDHVYLSLAVSLGKYAPHLVILQKLYESAPQTAITLDASTIADPYQPPTLDNRFFGINSVGEPVLYYQAMHDLLHHLTVESLQESAYQTLAGITIDL